MRSIRESFQPRVFWLVMPYGCDRCGYAIEFYLEDGCEGPDDVPYELVIESGPLRGQQTTWYRTASGRRVVPVPFVAGGCPKCQGAPPWGLRDGVLQHWGRDRELVPRLVGLPAGTARFHYPADLKDPQACGIPIFPPYAVRGQD